VADGCSATVATAIIQNDSDNTLHIGQAGYTGVLILAGDAGAITRSINLDAGTLAFSEGAILSSFSGLTVADGAMLDINGVDVLGEKAVMISGSGILSNGAITASIGSQSHAVANLTLAADATIGAFNDGTRWDIRKIGGTGCLIMNGFTLTKVGDGCIGLVDLDGVFANGNITVNGGELAIEGTSLGGDSSLTLAVAGGATLGWYSPDNTLTYNLDLADNARLFAGNYAVVTYGGPVTLSGSGTVPALVDAGASGTAFTDVIVGSGSLRVTNGTVVLAGNNTYTGATLISPGAFLQIGNGVADGGITNTGAIVIEGDGSLEFVTMRTGQNDNYYSIGITGSGQLLKAGPGMLALGAVQAYSGGTTIYDGTLRTDNHQPLPPYSALSVSGTGTWNIWGIGALDGSGHHYNGSDWQHLDTLSGDGRIVNRNGAATLFVGGTNISSSVFSGTISDAADSDGNGGPGNEISLVKEGSGTFTLTGSNICHGTITVSNGTLIVNGVLAGAGTVYVAPGATLGGTGLISGAVISGGVVAPGAGATNIGRLGMASLTQTGTGALAIKIGGGDTGMPPYQYDRLWAGGTVHPGMLSVSFINGFDGVGYGTFRIILSTNYSRDSITLPTAVNLPALSSGYYWDVINTANELLLTIVGIDHDGYGPWTAAIVNGLTNVTDCACGDGVPNLLKYATGSSPTNSDMVSRIRPGPVLGGYPSLQFWRNTDSTDVILHPEFNDSLTNKAGWVIPSYCQAGVWSGPASVSETGAGNPVLVTVQDIRPLTPGKPRFMRLRVIKP